MHRFILSRDAELDAARALLEANDAVLITGPAGIGKSAFIRRFGFLCEPDFPAGVLGMAVESGFPQAFDLMVEALTEWPLRGQALVVVDDPDRVEPSELQSLLERVRGSHVKVLLAARSERLSLFSGLDVAVLELQPFDQHQLKSLSQKMGLSADLASVVALLSEGNPRTALLLSDYAHGRDPRLLLSELRDSGFPTILNRDGRPMDYSAADFQGIQATVKGVNDALLHLLATNPADLHNLSPRRFEELVAELYLREGYEVALTPASADGGVDIYAVQWTPFGSYLTIVDCKQYRRDRKVGVSLVRSLYGTVEAKNASVGVLATTSSFTAGAEEFQQERKHRIGLQDFLAVQRMLEVHRP